MGNPIPVTGSTRDTACRQSRVVVPLCRLEVTRVRFHFLANCPERNFPGLYEREIVIALSIGNLQHGWTGSNWLRIGVE